VVDAKIRNSLHLVIKRGRKAETGEQSDRLRHILKQVPGARNLDRLRGLEGSASVAYFEAFRTFFKNDMGFSVRVKHPPSDPINILLSLGYSLLFNQVHAMIHCVGMDPYQGFYHQYRYGHPCLASDLVETLRAAVVDSLVLRVINLGIIQEKDFSQRDGKVIFEKPGLKRFLQEYDQRINTKRRFEPVGKALNFHQIIEWQCRHFARVLLGKEPEFKPYLWGGN
jgi:CRISPR-associated protein Cas1